MTIATTTTATLAPTTTTAPTITRPLAVIGSDSTPAGAMTLRDRVLADFTMHDALRGGAPVSGGGMDDGAQVQAANWNPLTLEEVRDDARRRAEEFGAVDVVRSLPLWHIDYRGHADLPAGRIAASYMTSRGMSEPVSMTRRALVQYCRDILPARGLGYNDALAALGPQGRHMATITTAMFAQQASDRARRVRLYRREDVDGVTRLTARAVVSDTYGVYSDAELLDQLLSEPRFAQLPVLAYRATDSSMRLRVALEPMEGPPVVGMPIPMVEVWNSEVGASSVALKAGVWTLHCTNGMAGWTRGMCRRWNHSGDMRRIREGVPQALDEMRVRAAGVVDQYGEALRVAIDDAGAWMDQMLADRLSAVQLTTAQSYLDDDRASLAPAGSLARVVDALTFSAHSYGDPATAEVVEHAGASLLGRGLTAARGGRLTARRSSDA